MNKIFIIGFNKCGTRTIHNFFSKNNIKSCWYTCELENTKKRDLIANVIYDNLNKNRKLLDYIDYYTVYSDMENIYSESLIYCQYLFKELDSEYPDSKFILNIRDVDNWIKSRKRHNIGTSSDGSTSFIEEGIYINTCRIKSGLHTNEQVVDKWKEDWNKHHTEVINYFKNRPNDLLLFDIETDDVQKIVDFFPNMNLNSIHYIHKGKTL